MKRQLSAEKKRLLFAGLAFIVILTAIFYLPGTRFQDSRTALTTDTKPVVDVLIIQRRDMRRTITLTGRTVPEARIDIAAKYPGRITWVNAALGQQVSAGDVLIIQDTGDVELSMAQTEAARRQAAADATETRAAFAANYQKAAAEYQRSLTNYDRYQSLYATGAVSREAFDTVEQQLINAKTALAAMDNQMLNGVVAATVESKQAALSKVEGNIASLEKQRDDLILRAPRSGTIGYRQAEAGAWVQSGQKLLSLVDNSSIYVDCQVSEQELAHIKEGLQADVQLESLGGTYPGRIIYVSPASDADTQSYSVRIALDKADPLIRSGMFARTAVEVLQRAQTLQLQREAVTEKNGKTYVMVIDAGGIVEERAVTTGLRNERDIEILSGLTEGEQVAVSNIARLRTGVAVAVGGAAPAANSGGQGGRQ